MLGAPDTPAIDATLTIAPPWPSATIARAATARTVITPSMLISTTRRASSSGYRSIKVAGADIGIGESVSGERATIGFRPETVVIGDDGPIPARIRLVEDLGSELFVHLVIDHEGEERRIVAKVDPPFAGKADDNVRLTLHGDVHLFDATEARRATVTL